MTNKKISALTSATTPLAGTETVPIVQSGATVKATIANIVGAGTSPGSFTTLAASDNITQSDKSKTTSFGYQETLTNAASTASLTRSIDSSGNVIDRVYKATGATYALYVHTTGDADQLAYTANADGSVTFTNNVVQGTAAKGVNFTANTPLAGKTSQLLNWYEEGTWTPTAVPGAGSITTYASGGTYTRVGRQVTVTAYVDLTNVGTASGALQISNLPFKNGAMSGAGYLQQMGIARETGVTGVNYGCVIAGGSPFTSIYVTSLTGGAILWVNTYQYALSITYYTA
jgi:hypothetical protein